MHHPSKSFPTKNASIIIPRMISVIHKTINNIVKNHPSTRQPDVELEVCRRIKNGNMRGSFYCPDQFWNTTQENQPLLGIVHQEVEGMKRLGLLKANEQTGELAIGNTRKQETSR